MKSIVEYKNLMILLDSICVLLLVTYFLFFSSDLKIEVFNKTDFDIDSLNIEGKYFKIKKQRSLVIKDCRKLSMQDNLPFGSPDAIIKNKQRDTVPIFLCGTGIEEVRSGNYKFNIEAQIEKDYYILYWTER